MKRKIAVILLSSVLLVGCASNNVGTAVNEDTQKVTNEATQVEEVVDSVETEEVDEEIWEMKTPAAVTNAPSEETIERDTQAILDKGVLLYEGEMDQGYFPGECDWLATAEPSDIVAIKFSCDVLDHGGWGVLGLSVSGTQIDIAAYADKPDKVRLITYTIGELSEIAGQDTLDNFYLGAWNGGHIHKLYFLSGDVAKELDEYNTSVKEASGIIHTYDGSLSNENAIEEAVVVYDYLKEVWAGQDHCLTGQMESTWMGTPDYEMNYINEIADKYPAIRGFDFIHNDFDGVVNRATDWWEKGGIPTICWHTGVDFASAYNESKDDNLDWDKALTPGTAEYKTLIANMDRAVPYLQKLEDAGVPVLWRPFHELDGGWFWWSRGGSENFVKLWQMMYSRYTDYWGLDNLIWVFGYSANGIDIANWYPGDDYVDLIGADSYTPGANKNLYDAVVEVAAEGMPIVFHECGTIPTEEQMAEDDARWLFFMVWTTDFITDEKNNTKDSINEIYNSDYFITLDELPSFK